MLQYTMPREVILLRTLNLSAKDIAALENRTEGWIAGLQLAARIFYEWNDMEAAEQHTQQSLQLWEYVGLKR